jgi:hypothetical protein
LWRHALELDYDGVDDLVRHPPTASCDPRWGLPVKPGHQVAVLGDDGRYHLLHNGVPACGGRPRADDPVDLIRHKQWCHWWADGTRYRVQAPASAWAADGGLVNGQFVERVTSWIVRLTETVAIPGLVPVRNRCVDDTNRPSRWPGYQGGENPLGRLRARLVREFGALCAACRRQWGTHVDHDHFTGLVRGLLCAGCNGAIDECPHASGCPFGDYLDHPPAARLNLRYPRSPRAGPDPLARVEQRIAALGFDPLYRGVRHEQSRTPHLPPPPPPLVVNPADWQEVSLF